MNGPSSKMVKFMREQRYLVLKGTDMECLGTTELQILQHICNKVDYSRMQRGKEPLECVLIERDWPEYGPTWLLLEERMNNE